MVVPLGTEVFLCSLWDEVCQWLLLSQEFIFRDDAENVSCVNYIQDIDTEHGEEEVNLPHWSVLHHHEGSTVYINVWALIVDDLMPKVLHSAW